MASLRSPSGQRLAQGGEPGDGMDFVAQDCKQRTGKGCHHGCFVDAALRKSARPRAALPRPRAALVAKRDSASASAIMTVAISSMRRLTLVPRRRANDFKRACLPFGSGE